MKVKMLHNPRCRKSRNTLALLMERGIEPNIQLYLESPPSAAELDRILELLDMQPRDLMRTGEAIYKKKGLDNPSLSHDELVAAMVAHPILIERPVVVAGNKAVIGRPPENILDII